MAGTMSTYMRNVVCDAIVDTLNAGKLLLKEAAGTLLVTLTFNNPAFSASGSTSIGRADLLTGTAVQDTSAIGGTISGTGGFIVQSANTAVFNDLTCGTSGTQIDLSSLTISSGDTVTLSSLRITVPATTT